MRPTSFWNHSSKLVVSPQFVSTITATSIDLLRRALHLASCMPGRKNSLHNARDIPFPVIVTIRQKFRILNRGNLPPIKVHGLLFNLHNNLMEIVHETMAIFVVSSMM